VTWRKLYRQAGDEVNQWESLTGAKVIDFRTESTDKEGCSSGTRKLSTSLLAIFCQRTVEELKCRAGIKPLGPGSRDSVAASIDGATVGDPQHYEWLASSYSILREP